MKVSVKLRCEERWNLFETHDGKRGLFLKTSLGFFPDVLAGLIKVIDSLQSYVIYLSPVKFFLM